jgi:hypothetical protein
MSCLIKTHFFGSNSYSVFAKLVATIVNISFIVIAPLVLLNLSTCSVRVDGSCMLRNTIAFEYDGRLFLISIVTSIGILALLLFYYVIE